MNDPQKYLFDLQGYLVLEEVVSNPSIREAQVNGGTRFDSPSRLIMENKWPC